MPSLAAEFPDLDPHLSAAWRRDGERFIEQEDARRMTSARASATRCAAA